MDLSFWCELRQPTDYFIKKQFELFDMIQVFGFVLRGDGVRNLSCDVVFSTQDARWVGQYATDSSTRIHAFCIDTGEHNLSLISVFRSL